MAKTTGNCVALGELIHKINDSHEHCLGSLRVSLAQARQTGNYLLEARNLTGKGKWREWVQDNCKFSVSQAERYVRIADHYFELLDKAKDKDNLTMTEAIRILSPKKEQEGAAGAKATVQRFTVFSDAEASDRAMEASQLRFPDDSPEAAFIKEKIESFARQALALAKRSKLKGEEGKAIDPAQVAIALIQRVKDAIKLSLVVQVGDEKPAKNGHVSKAKPASNGHTPVNRVNGKFPATKS